MFSSTRVRVSVAAVAVVIAVPALAHGQGAPSTASYTASDSAAPNSADTFRWYVSGTTGTDATITAGGTVSFSSPTSAVRAHNVLFTAAQPTCQLSTGGTPTTGPMPPAVEREWSGTCTFAQPGTYPFRCVAHPAMAGTITVVEAPVATPSPVAPTSPGSGPAPAPGGGAPAANQPLAAVRITVGHRQRGTRVSGSLTVSRAGTRVEITLLARRTALGQKGKRRVRVGHSVIASAPAGSLRFSVALNAAARKALRDRKALPVLVQVEASAPLTTPVDRSESIRLKSR